MAIIKTSFSSLLLDIDTATSLDYLFYFNKITGLVEQLTVGANLSISSGVLNSASIATPPGGATTQLQYNNAGVFGGIAGVTFNGAFVEAKTNAFRIVDPTDVTKLLNFNLSGNSAAVSSTFSFANTSNAIYSFPDATTTMVGHNTVQTLTNKTLTNLNTVTLFDNKFTLQDDADASKQLVFQLSSIASSTIITLTAPNVSGTLSLDGAITTRNFTMSTGKILGRSTALTGAIEEITVGSGLSLSAGVLSASGGGGGTVTSVAVTVPSHLSVAGSPITTAGTIAITLSGTALPVSSGGTGATTAFTTGSVIFAGASGTYTQNNANFFWDDTNTRLGIRQAVPTSVLHQNFNVNSVTQSDANGHLLANTSAATVGLQSISPPVIWQGNGWKTNATAGSQDVRFRAYTLPVQGAANPTGTWILQSSINAASYVTQASISSAGLLTMTGGIAATTGTFTGDIIRSGFTASGNNISTSAFIIAGLSSTNTTFYRTTNAGADLSYRVAATASLTAAGTHLYALDGANLNGLLFCAGNGTRQVVRACVTITNLNNTAGSEAGDLSFQTQTAGAVMVERMRLTGAGGAVFPATNTAAGTTGNQTINKPSGTVNIAAAGTTVTVTNSLVTTASIVYCVVRTNDTTALIKNVVPNAGNFVVTLNAATTAETSIGFFVIN